MKIIKRKHCEMTGSKNLEHLYTFKNFPVYMGCTLQDETTDKKFDMSWEISKESGIIQLSELLPLEVLYPESHGSGCIGGLWDEHHRNFASFIHKYNPSSILEIGGAHGILSKVYHDFQEVDWTIIEPNPTPLPGVKAKFLKTFFDDSFKFEDHYDTIVHSHVFEHIYYPSKFVEHLSNFIGQQKTLLFSIPNLRKMLKNRFTNALNFEHTVYLSEEYVDIILNKFNFEILEKVYFRDDHSIFYACKKVDFLESKQYYEGFYQNNKKLFFDYIQYHKDIVYQINSKIKDYKDGVFIFGAHIFTQYLLAFGVREKNIINILDNDTAKQNKRLYGTSLYVESPKVLNNYKKPMVILKAGFYDEEIKADILNNINSETIFI